MFERKIQNNWKNFRYDIRKRIRIFKGSEFDNPYSVEIKVQPPEVDTYTSRQTKILTTVPLKILTNLAFS